MDASALTSDQVRELALLRARAYGPAADIQSDPRALARLRELESLTTTVPALAVPRPAAVDSDPERAVGPREPAVPAGADAVAVSSARSGGPRSLLRRSLRTVPVLGWVVSAAAMVVVVAVVWGTGQVTALRPDAVLAPLADSEPPAEYLRQGVLGYYPMDEDRFRQFESIRTLGVWSADDGHGNRCILVATPGFRRIGGGESCAPPGLDPTYDLSIWPGLPSEVTDGLPQGSVIRFVLHGDRVNVWVRAGQWRSDD